MESLSQVQAPTPQAWGNSPGGGGAHPQIENPFPGTMGFSPAFHCVPTSHLTTGLWKVIPERAGLATGTNRHFAQLSQGLPPFTPHPPKSSLAFRKGKAFPTPASQAVEEAWQVCNATCDPGGAWRDREGAGAQETGKRGRGQGRERPG